MSMINSAARSTVWQEALAADVRFIDRMALLAAIRLGGMPSADDLYDQINSDRVRYSRKRIARARDIAAPWLARYLDLAAQDHEVSA